MAPLGPINRLMQPVEWQGKVYYTSQYFHAHYRQQKAEDGTPGKYAQHVHFLRKIRSIESYESLVRGGHIVEIAWDTLKSGPIPNLDRFKPLFKSTGYYDIILLDKTAQLELSHHLDDELSKEIAYRHSKSTAEGPPPRKLTMQDILKALSEGNVELREIAEEAREGAQQARAGVAEHSYLLKDVQENLQAKEQQIADLEATLHQQGAELAHLKATPSRQSPPQGWKTVWGFWKDRYDVPDRPTTSRERQAFATLAKHHMDQLGLRLFEDWRQSEGRVYYYDPHALARAAEEWKGQYRMQGVLHEANRGRVSPSVWHCRGCQRRVSFRDLRGGLCTACRHTETA